MTMLVLAMWTATPRFYSNSLVVFAEYDSCLVIRDILGTHVRVHGNVLVAVWVVGVFVVAHGGGVLVAGVRCRMNRCRCRCVERCW